MQVQSKFDPATYYVVTSKYVRICRDGDKMTISYGQLPEQAKRFMPEIQEELMAIYTQKHPLVSCKWCGKPFHEGANKLYCSDECKHAAGNERSRLRQCVQFQTCVWCGKEFQGYNGRKYCSKACKKESMSANRKEDTRGTWESHLQEKLQQAEAQGMTYAEMQKAETLKMVGKVVI